MKMVAILRPAGLAGLVLGLLGGPAAGAPPLATDACFDVAAEAWIVRQTYSPMPDCRNCLVVRWPWRIDLKVERVTAGRLEPGPLQVQSLQHTYIREDHAWQVWLRRNTLGGFNLVALGEAGDLAPCPDGAPPATAYDNRPG